MSGALVAALERFVAAAGAERFAAFVSPAGSTLEGEFEVRSADGRVRRMQRVSLPLPPPLAKAFAHRAPVENLPVDMGTHALTWWSPRELIELQVGYRWHGFNGKRMREWDERYVVFAEDGGDPLALRVDEADGPVWLSHRGEGRHAFFQAAPSLAVFFEVLADWLELKSPDALRERLVSRYGAEIASRLWLWKQQISREESRR